MAARVDSSSTARLAACLALALCTSLGDDVGVDVDVDVDVARPTPLLVLLRTTVPLGEVAGESADCAGGAPSWSSS